MRRKKAVRSVKNRETLMKSVKCIQKSNNKEVIIYDKANEVIGKFFESLANRHQAGNIDDK